MKVILLGNRGSRPIGASEGSPFAKYGGDTTCIGVTFDDGTIVSLDAGSGFWKWPYTLKTLMGHEAPFDMHLLLSHFHLDHTMGLAQSEFLFGKDNTISIYGPDFAPGLKRVFEDSANKPFNPDLAKLYAAKISFNTLADTDTHKSFELPNGAKVSYLFVPHGDEQSIGYRIDHEGQSLVVISDTHHIFDKDDKPVLSKDIIEFIDGANMMIYDSHFSDKELNDSPFFRTFGHSTGEHGVRLCAAAGVPMLISHHHNPANDDKKLDEMSRDLRFYGYDNNVFVVPAMPSLTIDLTKHPQEILKDLSEQDSPEKRWQFIAGRSPK